ncbi:MAG: DUF58 domain-containing protein [Bdellovibrionaceae bacterium]|nr:DUF58 domain-containing protein [Pseudobdellovibrionaceae bacterium]
MLYKSPIPSDVYRYVKQLEIKTRKLVQGNFSGLYTSSLKGNGINFSGFREYVYGDDTRNISWPLTARTGKTYLKEFEEERELQVILLVDISSSMNFGSNSMKKEISAYLSALLAFTAIKNKDKVGLLLFSDEVEHFIKPQKNKQTVYDILFKILSNKNIQKKTSLKSSVKFLQNVLNKKAHIFILSDFDFFLQEEKVLQTLSSKHEVFAIHIRDQWERELPNINAILRFSNLESETDSQEVIFDCSSVESCKKYKELVAKKELLIKAQLKKSNIPKILVESDQKWALPIINFFNQ